ncbi:MAG: hypothetical protein Kow0037_03890 [Calditrichia bacterium]
MQKNRLFQYLAFILLLAPLTLLQPGVLYAQNWAELYKTDQIAILQEYRQNGQIKNPEWVRLVDLLFEEDLEQALPGYVDLFEKTNNTEIRKIVLDRLSQYYYARGLYETADKIFEDQDFRDRIFETKKLQEKFWGVQVGAFKSYENALNAKKELLGSGEAILIKAENNLYKVIVGKCTSENEVKKLQKKIKQRYNKKGLIISYFAKGD